jgi:hypothetical protein
MKNQTILRGRAITASQYGDTWCVHLSLCYLGCFSLRPVGGSTARSLRNFSRQKQFRDMLMCSTMRPTYSFAHSIKSPSRVFYLSTPHITRAAMLSSDTSINLHRTILICFFQ